MKSNLWLILGTAAFFGLATGIYEYVLPFFLQTQGINFNEMALIFTISGAVMVLVRIYMGGLSDLWGRKPLFGLALFACGIGTASPVVVSGLLSQILLKVLRDTATLTRETIFPVVLYEEQRSAFLNFIGKFRGVEYMVQAGGTLLAGATIAWCAGHATADGAVAGYRVALFIAGGALLLAAMGWVAFFREHPRVATTQTLTLRQLFDFDMHPNLRIIMLAGLFFTFAVTLSHSFYLPLFYPERFPEYARFNPLLMSLHRVTIALPLLVVGNLPIKNIRAWYCWGYVIEGATMAACAVIPHFWLSAGIFLLHDLIGAGLWSPIQASLIQRFSRDDRRGVETGKVLAWTSLGAIVAPSVTSMLAKMSPIYPFLFSGIFMILAAIPLLWIRPNAPEPTPAQVVEVAG